MRVFISHAHEERYLADAWKQLLGRLIPDVFVWYSSDMNPEGGIGTGPWRTRIRQELGTSDVILAILSPESHARPWIVWECALASGLNPNGVVIPIVFFMSPERLHDTMKEHVTYVGDDRQSVLTLCRRLVARSQGRPNVTID